MFKDGDRVKIKIELANGFNQPFRKFAMSGRLGTVKIPQYMEKSKRVLVIFDVLRKNTIAERGDFDINSLELVDNN